MASFDNKPIAEITEADVRQLCEEGRQEGPQFEIKQDIETKGDGSFKPAAIAKIAKA